MKKQLTTIVLTLVIGIAIGLNLKPSTLIQPVHAEVVSKPFPVDSVIMYMKELNIKYPEFSFAQMQKETGHFTSPIFKENFNLVGMKLAVMRPTTAIGENRGHAQYKSWRESVLDFAILQTRILAITKNKKKYFEYINEYYSANRNYVEECNELVLENRLQKIF